MRRVLTFTAATAAVLASYAMPSGRVAAAPSPSSLTVTAGGAVASFSGGPITGSADGSGNAAPPPACAAPACESIPLTVKAPAGLPAKQIWVTVTVYFNAPATNPLGLTGLDAYLLDSSGNLVDGDTLGSAPSVAVGGQLDPGSYTVEISGEAGAAAETYTGTVLASIGPPPEPSAHQLPTPLRFSPAALVSPTILGGEPQISFERPVAGAQPGLDPQRGFVDWPVSSRTNIGTLWRTLNGGDSYRQIVDPSCSVRQVPNCNTGGGGDTVNRVNNYDGTLLFGDQESLAAEALASSTDHGDTFPATRQFAVTAAGTGVDRQWISSVDAPNVMGGPVDAFALDGVFSYHIPGGGEYVSGIDTSGLVHPAVAPVIPLVSQSGPSRVDVQPGSHGRGYFYQSYRDSVGFRVAVAPLSQYQSPAGYVLQTVTTDQPQVFPWIALDTQGNLYAVWVSTDGNLYLSDSLIDDPANDPTARPAGVPGTKWSSKVRINPPALGSTVFPEIVAGDPGRIAITYMATGTGGYTGVSDGAPATAQWDSYVSLSTDALSSAPQFQIGMVQHRWAHTGTICTAGTTCVAAAPMGDRSLLDMIDVTMDVDGRVAVVYSDNQNAFAPAETSQGSQGSPYIKVARLASGPSLLAGHGPYAYTYPTAYRTSAAGDATWPNSAAGTNIPSLDILGSGVSASGGQVVGRIDLADGGAAAFTRDLGAYNTQNSGSLDPAATRLQYLLRWEDGTDGYYMAAESDASGNLTYYGGKVDGGNAISNGTSAVGIAYRPQTAFPVTGEVSGHTLLLKANMSQFHLATGSTLQGLAAYSLAGPSDGLISAQPASSQIFTAMRTVDASPPMDAVLAASAAQSGGTPPGGGAAPATVSTPNTAAAGPAGAAAPLAALALLGVGAAAGARRRRERRR
jgi:hypothetical protein